MKALFQRRPLVSWVRTTGHGTRALTLVLALVASIALTVSGAQASYANAPPLRGTQGGQITFARQVSDDPDSGHTTYVVDPDGSHLQAEASPADFPRWSPDGKRLAVGDMPCMFGGSCAAVIVKVRTGEARTLPDPAPETFDQFFGCTVWSPDGERLACGGLGSAPGVSGVYTVRAGSGTGLTKVLSCDNECGPADYSPDGRRLALVGNDDQGITQLYTVRLDGTGLRQITHLDVSIDGDSSASWSPDGSRLLFSGRSDQLYRRGVFEVNADGSGLHQVPIPRCGGALDADDALGCFGPSWSPDGKRIAYDQLDPASGIQDVYTAAADGSHPYQVTHDTSGLAITATDWGAGDGPWPRRNSAG